MFSKDLTLILLANPDPFWGTNYYLNKFASSFLCLCKERSKESTADFDAVTVLS